MSPDRVASFTRHALAVVVLLAAWFVASIIWPADSPVDQSGVVPDREGRPGPVTTLETQGGVVLVGDETLMQTVALHVWADAIEQAEHKVEQVPPTRRVGPVEVAPPHSPAAEATTPKPEVEPAPAVAIEADHPFLVCTRAHESDTAGGYQAVDPSGAHRGAYQFRRATWDATARHAGRHDLIGVDPATASPADQDAMALHLYLWEGNKHWGGRC